MKDKSHAIRKRKICNSNKYIHNISMMRKHGNITYEERVLPSPISGDWLSFLHCLIPAYELPVT